jgi:hypothetical protein
MRIWPGKDLKHRGTENVEEIIGGNAFVSAVSLR